MLRSQQQHVTANYFRVFQVLLQVLRVGEVQDTLIWSSLILVKINLFGSVDIYRENVFVLHFSRLGDLELWELESRHSTSASNMDSKTSLSCHQSVRFSIKKQTESMEFLKTSEDIAQEKTLSTRSWAKGEALLNSNTKAADKKRNFRKI
jgi:hypothetical protein